jgi:5-methylcytosine-specific restriction endonuclease McrBC regulatory subunit McrC
MREEELCESTTALLELEPHHEVALRRLGIELASSSAWWGSSRSDDIADERSVIRIEPDTGRRFRVTVLNMIGAIALDGLHIRILPKIPISHFLHIIQDRSIEPRAGGAAQLELDESLAELVARWFIAEAEVLLRRGLRSEYLEVGEELNAVRGQVQLMETALQIQQGRPVAVCRFDDLGLDSPLNRLIKGAAREIAKNVQFSAQVRQRARQVDRRMEGVSIVRPADFQVAVDRLARDYAMAVPLGKLVLRGLGVGTRFGDTAGRTFLLRTPELVEEGIRRLIARALPRVHVTAGKQMLGTTGLSLNPDLVFDRGNAVGDIKYKLQSSSWNRSDLYQALAFATAYRTNSALLVGFHKGSMPLQRELRVGDVRCRLIAWNASAEVSPQEAQLHFEQEVRGWHTDQLNTLGALLRLA